MSLPVSILDLALVAPGTTVADSFAASVRLAQRAESLGYQRVWYAEHHNIPSIASSATSVLVAHVATFTRSIRLGAGGIMLPNHSPLVIAEQFGTLETLHPGRIDLGLGRAPGGDMDTVRALRRYAASADEFPRDVVELQGYLSDRSRMPGVEATPGKGTRVPLFILGSSLFGAELAAAMGLPYAFASHFAPDALEEAVALYRREFRPSEQLREPYVIAGLTVTAADDAETARAHRRATMRLRVGLFLGKGRTFSDAEADALLESPAGQGISRMGRYWACGTAEEVGKYAREFARHAQADELITVHACLGVEERLRSLELFAEAMGLGAERAPRASSMSTG